MAMAMRWGGPVGAPPIELKAALDALEEERVPIRNGSQIANRARIGGVLSPVLAPWTLLLCVGFVLCFGAGARMRRCGYPYAAAEPGGGLTANTGGNIITSRITEAGYAKVVSSYF